MAGAEFDGSYFALLDAAQGHWWVQGMREVGAALLGPTAGPLAVLDAGCGAGANLPWLASLAAPGRVSAVDFSAAAVERCRTLPLPLDILQASVARLPFTHRSFDLVVTTDVLQHLTEEDEEVALSEMRRVLRPGGRLLVRTNSVFGRRRVSQRDDWRLYSPDRLEQTLVRAGLIVDRLTSANSLQGLWASLPRPPRGQAGPHHGASGGPLPGHGLGLPQPVGPARNATMLRLLRWEADWLRPAGRRLPFGHSLIALAHAPPDPRP